jgi:guanylate kinase
MFTRRCRHFIVLLLASISFMVAFVPRNRVNLPTYITPRFELAVPHLKVYAGENRVENSEERKVYEGEEIKGRSLILCGPSGAGKGAIIDILMKRDPGTYELCVSHTSRPPRPGEINGTHYFFVSKEFMSEEIKKDEASSSADSSALTYKFLEYAEVHGNFYGTSVSSVRNIHQKDLTAILDIDTLGVQGIHELNILPAKYVFVAPPSLEELENRLRARGTETEDQIEVRLRNAVSQMEFGINSEIFDYILENDKLEVAVDELDSKLVEWGP